MIDKKQLLLIVAGTYAILSFLLPYVLSVIDPELPNLAGGAGSLCPYGWTEADGSCFKYFGQAEEEYKTWPEAELVCREHGSHLVSITSEAKNDVVRVMMAEASVDACWIGLTDAAEEGSWVWSDGEALLAEQGFEAWGGGEPGEYWPETVHCAAYAGEDCGGMSPGYGWWDGPCEFLSREPGGEGEVPGQPGCYPHHLPFVCSKPAAPIAAHGGSMYGCVDGHWVMGMAHSSNDLPPTAVRARCAFPINPDSAPLHLIWLLHACRRSACTTPP